MVTARREAGMLECPWKTPHEGEGWRCVRRWRCLRRWLWLWLSVVAATYRVVSVFLFPWVLGKGIPLPWLGAVCGVILIVNALHTTPRPRPRRPDLYFSGSTLAPHRPNRKIVQDFGQLPAYITTGPQILPPPLEQTTMNTPSYFHQQGPLHSFS